MWDTHGVHAGQQSYIMDITPKKDKEIENARHQAAATI
jgi:hypothetical protein